jgi:hypothetical protein
MAVHLAGCKQLRELQLTVPWCEMFVYPTGLIQDFAEQLTGLVKLSIDIDDSNDEESTEGKLMDRFGEDLFRDSPEDWGPIVLADIKRLPLVLAGEVYNVTSNILIPPPNLSTLTSVQQLHVSGWWLVATSEHQWRVLAGCSSLQSLRGLHASVPPPAGVTFPGVTQLEVTTSTSPGDTVVLLGAFPVLREVALTMVPTDSGADEVSMPVSGCRAFLRWVCSNPAMCAIGMIGRFWSCSLNFVRSHRPLRVCMAKTPSAWLTLLLV